MLNLDINTQRKSRKLFSGERFEVTAIYIIIILFIAGYIIPFLWLLSGSFKTNTEMFAVPPVWIPAKFQFQNYVKAFTGFPFLLYFKNTMIIIVLNILGTLISSSLVAYGFSRLRWKYRDRIFLIVLVTMMLPFQVIMVPLFLLFNKFGWIGTLLPLFITSWFGHPFSIFLLRQFFVSIPFELSESARIDGTTELGIYWRIILPLAKSALATVAIFSFLHNWSDFIGPLVFLSKNKLYTLSLGVQQIIGEHDPQWPLLMALGVSMTLPVLIIFFLLQRYFIQGIALSGIKG